jgi:hypothetical protein
VASIPLGSCPESGEWRSLVLSTITRFSVRSSGRDLSAVRRPKTTPKPDLASLRKPDLVALAEAQVIDSSGTVADLRERLSDE